jgi:lipopolysaccharide export system permease protein
VDAALVTLLTLPGHAYTLFPMAALIGALLALGGLAARAELDAFRLAGCSPARLLRAVLQSGGVLLLAAVAVGEGWAPLTTELAGRVRASALFDGLSVTDRSAFWVRDGQRLIQIGASTFDGSLEDIRVFSIGPSSRLDSALAIARARHRRDGWEMEDIRVTRFTPTGIEVEYDERQQWPALIDPRLAQLLRRRPDTLFLSELSDYIALQPDGSDADRYRFALWHRLAAPVSALAMLLLSVGIALGPMGHRSAGQRILAGVLIGLAFKLASETLVHAGLVYRAPAWLSTLLPAVLVAAAGLVLLRREGV